jgi:SAM-dependent methyltransferase
MQIVNTAPAKAWNGYEGTHWAEHNDRYDAVNSGFNEHLLGAAAIGSHDRVLDIGCGTGQVTRLAGRRARDGHAVGLDLSEPMLARARDVTAAEGPPNVTYQLADAQVHPLPAASFDVALSRFGIMFFADPVAAFANIGRTLAPSGRLAFLSMRHLAHHDLGEVLAALSSHLPPDIDDEPDPATGDTGGPTSLADPAVINDVLTRAGFAEITTTAVDAPQHWGRDVDDAATFLAGWGPIRHLLAQVDATAATRATGALRTAMRRYERPDGVRLRGAAWLVTAVRPGGPNREPA